MNTFEKPKKDLETKELELEPEVKVESGLEGVERDPEQGEAERQESLKEARERIKETSGEQELDPEEQGELSADEFFEEARATEGRGEMKEPEGIRDSKVLNNLGAAKEIRERTAERKVAEVFTALTEIYGDLKDAKEKFEIVMDIGAGWGENIAHLAEALGAKEVIGVDTDTVPTEEVREKMKNELAWVVGDALETMKKLESGSVNLTTAFALLQVLDRSEKIEMLKEMGRVTQECIVIVDELKRDGIGGLKDLIQNRLSNLFKGEFNVLEKEEWESIFKEAGFVIEAFNEFRGNDFVAVLRKVEKTEEVE